MNNKIFSGIALVAAGLIVGYLIWGNSKKISNSHSVHDKMDMTAMMAGMNAALAGKQGEDFDKAFIEEMIIHHQGAIDMAKLALTNAKHEEIKTLANAIIAAQTTEINQMKEWKNSWFK